MNNSYIYGNKKQSGVVLIITLISLVIMLIASVALIRSTDTNLLIAGSLAFKRDVVNQAERIMPSIISRFSTGTLSSGTSRIADSLAVNNYSATILPSDSKGVPNILKNISTFDAAMPSNNVSDAGMGITVRYVIDRMCVPGVDEANLSRSCTMARSGTDIGGGGLQIPRKLPGKDAVVYRISIRATGPKNTEAFIQSSFTI